MQPLKLSAAVGAAALTATAALPAAPAQARGRNAAPVHHVSRHHVARSHRVRHTRGKIVAVGGEYVTIRRPGHAHGVLASLIREATRITAHNYPYVWGGGHAQAGVASVGMRGGHGYNGKRKGFDCSGSVAAVLVAGGLWPQGAGVPSDKGVIAELRSQHLIARGAGTGPREVTLYDYPGVHIFMNIDGRFFGTSDGAGGANRRGGPGWLNDGAWDLHNRHFKRWHVLPSVLHTRTRAGLLTTFTAGSNWTLLQGFGLGDQVSVGYVDSRFGTMVAKSVKLHHQRQLTGTVTAFSGSTLTVTLANGNTRDLTVMSGVSLYGLQVGDTVSVTYTRTRDSGTVVLQVHAITITATPAPPTTTTTTTTTTSGTDANAYGYSTTGGGTSISQTPPDGGYSLNG